MALSIALQGQLLVLTESMTLICSTEQYRLLISSMLLAALTLTDSLSARTVRTLLLTYTVNSWSSTLL
jgi:hypothetical protein